MLEKSTRFFRKSGNVSCFIVKSQPTKRTQKQLCFLRKNDGPLSCVGARQPRKERGAGGWITRRSCAGMGDSRSGKCPEGGIAPSPDRTAKLALFMALGFVRFVGESTYREPPAFAPKGYNASRWAA
jgi:hypothetical protein